MQPSFDNFKQIKYTTRGGLNWKVPTKEATLLGGDNQGLDVLIYYALET